MSPCPDRCPDDDRGPARPSADALDLLLEATRPGASGSVVLVVEPGPASCTAGGRQFVADESPWELWRWEAAVRELVRAGLARDPGPGGTVYPVTAAGFDLADGHRPTGTPRARLLWPLGAPPAAARPAGERAARG